MSLDIIEVDTNDDDKLVGTSCIFGPRPERLTYDVEQSPFHGVLLQTEVVVFP